MCELCAILDTAELGVIYVNIWGNYRTSRDVSIKWPDHTIHSLVSDLGLHYLLKACLSENWVKPDDKSGQYIFI